MDAKFALSNRDLTALSVAVVVLAFVLIGPHRF
jgi:hypothetical protein